MLHKMTDEFGDSYFVTNREIEDRKYVSIKIKCKKGIDAPKIHPTGNWIDLHAAERVELIQGDHKLISLGISMQLPVGYEAYILPRSSTYKKWGIIMANGMGIVDNTYCGDNDIWMFSAIAMRDTVIEVNDRIAQFRVVPVQPPIIFNFVENLRNSDRGGFGSTG
jgi:dUTP pyrophosphatase